MKSLFIVAAAILSLTSTRTTPKELIICDQKNERIVMVDVANSNAITWEWKAAASYAMVRPAAQGWFSNLSDAKLVYDGRYILATASGGGVALIEISSRRAAWYAYAGGNTHSAELLPDGNVVTASTTGGYLKIFSVDTLADDASAQSAPIAFEDVHNVVWDHQRQLLYAAGKNKLKKFSYNGNCRSPELRLLDTYTMPQGGAHDLFPVHGSTEELWLSSSGNVYRFNVIRGAFSQVKRLKMVKSVSSGPSGYPVIAAVANNRGGETWRTDHVTDLDAGNAVFADTSFGLYKVRWKVLNTFSYPLGDAFRVCTR